MKQNETEEVRSSLDFFRKARQIDRQSYIFEAICYASKHVVLGFCLLSLMIGFFPEHGLNESGKIWKYVSYSGLFFSSIVWLCSYTFCIVTKKASKSS